MKKILFLLILLPQILSAQLRFLPLPIGTGVSYIDAGAYDPTHKGSGVTLSNGNKTASIVFDGHYNCVLGVVGASSGKKYFEFRQDDPSNMNFGIATIAINLNNYLGQSTTGVGYISLTGAVYYNGGFIVTGLGTLTTGDIIGVALDMTNGAVYFAKNNTWQNGGVPTSGASMTGAIKTGLTGTWYPVSGTLSGSGTQINTIRTSAATQTYSPPSGYSPLN